jgi:hypothetical protein
MNFGIDNGINNSGFLDYSRAKIAAEARKWPMKLYLYTVNGLQRSRCSEIGSPEGEKMPMKIKRFFLKSLFSNVRIIS